MARNPQTTKLRARVVRAFNRGKTQAEIAAELGLTRGVVGRLLAEARVEGQAVVSYTTSETAQRAATSARQRMGDQAYDKRMQQMRGARCVNQSTQAGQTLD